MWQVKQPPISVMMLLLLLLASVVLSVAVLEMLLLLLPGDSDLGAGSEVAHGDHGWANAAAIVGVQGFMLLLWFVKMLLLLLMLAHATGSSAVDVVDHDHFGGVGVQAARLSQHLARPSNMGPLRLSVCWLLGRQTAVAAQGPDGGLRLAALAARG